MKQRTTRQNSSLHLYLDHLASALNDSGLTIQKTLRQDVEIPWTMTTAKELIYKPILKAQFGKTSTTQMSTKEIDEVFDTITKFMGEKHGLFVDFPSVDSQLEKQRTRL